MIYCTFEMPFISNVQRRILSTTVGDTRAKWWGIGWAKRKRNTLNVEYEILDLLRIFLRFWRPEMELDARRKYRMYLQFVICDTSEMRFVSSFAPSVAKWMRKSFLLLVKILTMTPHFFISLFFFSLSPTLPPTRILLACPGMKQCYELTASLCLPVDWSMRLVPRCTYFFSLSFSFLLYYSLFFMFAFFFVHNASCVWTGEIINPWLSESIHRHRRCRASRDKRPVAAGNMVLFVANCWLTNEVVI